MATPVLALFVDVKVAVPVLVLPNLIMDAIQVARLGELLPTARRMAVLLAFGLVGTFIGTRLLVVLSGRAVTLVMGGMVLLFVALNATRFRPRVSPAWAPWLAPPVGFIAGVTGGLANVPGLPLVIYFYSLRMEKTEFVRTVAVTFIVYKIIQLGAAAWYGLLGWGLLAASVALAGVGLGAFWLGLRVQDRLDPRAFNRAVLGFLAVLGGWLMIRASL
ncbi:MAG: sulfite exporter TauE/SafE family protein [Candidatus Rokubacteria bacterium]|nr:sulfite exporter TauE/SafE family protein [Candidatus Rokubacteria bacterium]